MPESTPKINSTPHRDKTLAAGFNTVADTVDGIAHAVEGPCWQEGKRYIPFASIEEALQHGNAACTKCSGGSTYDNQD